MIRKFWVGALAAGRFLVRKVSWAWSEV